MTSVNSMHKAGHSKPVLWDSPEGWGEVGGGSGWEDACAPVAVMSGKNHHNIVR